MQHKAETIRLPATNDGFAQAAALLRRGCTVAIPTETVYGLAADAGNPAAVARIYAAKGRPAHNPLIVHVGTIAQARALAVFTAEAEALATAFWPGPLTLVLPLRPGAGLAPAVTAGGDSVALRVPRHPVALAVLTGFGGPLAAPSANPSGRISPTSAAHVLDPQAGLAGRIAAVVDAGPCAVGVESTILGWNGAGTPVILRPGGIPAQALAQVLGRPVVQPGAPQQAQADAGAPVAPGMLASHYAPAAALRLNAKAPRSGETFIGFGAIGGDLNLSPAGDLAQAAANLFDMLRRADAMGRPIAVAPIPGAGLGAAINDRLARAAVRPDSHDRP